MTGLPTDPVERFADAAERFCSWCTQEGPAEENDLALLCGLVANLVAAGCSLGWQEGEPSELECEAEEMEAVSERASTLPFQYYSEVFNPLVVPAEEPVTGDLVDDLMDMYRDIAPGLILYRRGDHQEATDHWRFWFTAHWGEHATSVLRVVWSFLAGRVRSSLQTS